MAKKICQIAKVCNAKTLEFSIKSQGETLLLITCWKTQPTYEQKAFWPPMEWNLAWPQDP